MASLTHDRNYQLKELVKAGKDPHYFINEYCKIQHMQRGLIPFKTYEFQDNCIRQFVDHRLNVILKSRQLGISTITAAFAAWLALFYRDQNILVIATKRDTAQNFVRKVKIIVKNIPKWMQLTPLVGDNKESLEFGHRSVIKACATSEDAGRSEALSLLIIDEAGWIPGFETLWTGLQPTLSTGGKCIVISTPHGVGNMFHSLYADAESGMNDFNPIRLPWNVHPERDEAWFEHECRQLGGSKKKISQELLCEFVTSGETFLSPEDIEWVGTAIEQPRDKWADDKSFWVWTYPQPEHKYIIPADVSRGDAADYSAFHIIDMNTADVVAEYKGRMPPDRFAMLLAETGKKYNNALLCPESNSYGYSVLMKLRDFAYPRVYKQDSKAVYVIDYSPVTEDPANMGFRTDGKTRIQILTKLEEIIRNRLIKVHSSRFYDELKTFVWNGAKAKAMKGRNDDLVMSLAIGLWLYDVSEGHNTRDVAMHDAMLKSFQVTSNAFSDLPGSGKGVGAISSMQAPYMRSMAPIMLSDSPEMAADPRFRMDQFGWLFGK